MSNPEHVINYQSPEVQEDVSYEEEPLCILDRKEKVLKTRDHSICEGIVAAA